MSTEGVIESAEQMFDPSIDLSPECESGHIVSPTLEYQGCLAAQTSASLTSTVPFPVSPSLHISGLYLTAPHARLIYDGHKTSIVTGKRRAIPGLHLLCSKEDGEGLAFGVIAVGDPACLSAESFDARVSSHHVSRQLRRKWWPGNEIFYDYPILRFHKFPHPISYPIEPGVTMEMGMLELTEEHGDLKQHVLSYLESGKAYPFCTSTSVLATCAELCTISSIESEKSGLSGEERLSDSPESPDSESLSSSLSDSNLSPVEGEKGDEMPYTIDNPPRPAQNWTQDEKKRCVEAANAVLREDPSDERGAVFACIRAAGKTKHPGGKSCAPSDYAIATELVKGFISVSQESEELSDLEKSTMGVGESPDSASLQKSGDLADSDLSTCTCPKCNTIVDKEDDEICADMVCPQCNARMHGDAGDADTDKCVDEGVDGSIGDKAGELDVSLVSSTSLKGVGLDIIRDLLGNVSILSLSYLEDARDALQTVLSEVSADNRQIIEQAIEEIEAEIMRRGMDHTAEPRTIPDHLKSIYNRLVASIKSIFTASSDPSTSDLSTSDPSASDIFNSPGSLDSYAFKTYTSPSTNVTWFEIWPTNTYQDRDGEFFTSKALSDFVARHADCDIKGEVWFKHVPGSKFGTIYHQAVVEDIFLVQLGTFDDTPIGNAFKEFFSRHPTGHPVIAPLGWGASHGFIYKESDRDDRTYDWFDIKESSVLPVHYAANLYNPRPMKMMEVVTMNAKDRETFAEIGKAIGVDNLADLIESAARNKKEQIGDMVKHKAVEEGEEVKSETPADVIRSVVNEQVPQIADIPSVEDRSHIGAEAVINAIVSAIQPLLKQVGKSEEVEGDALAEDLQAKLEGKQKEGDENVDGKDAAEKGAAEKDATDVISAVVDALQLDRLSDVLADLTKQVNEVKERLAEVEQADEQKVRQAVKAAPQFSWFVASQLPDTQLESKPILSKSHIAVPDAVNAIAEKLAGNRG